MENIEIAAFILNVLGVWLTSKQYKVCWLVNIVAVFLYSQLRIQRRVKGVNRLRVVDASAMPEITTVNPNITVMMMGEKCAEMIKNGQ